MVESFFKLGFCMELICYILVHINPPLSAVGDFDYNQITVYIFASNAIFQI
jgi:hypothetical protein